MRTRAYRPDVLACLENRSLLSGVAALSAGHLVPSRLQLNRVAEQIRVGFLDFGVRGQDINNLRGTLSDLVVIIPFARVDGLGLKINGILGNMQHDLSAKVPYAVVTASNDVVAAFRAQVQAHVHP